MTDVFEGLRETHPDVVNDEDNREPLVEAARAVYDGRDGGFHDGVSDYEALREAVEAAIDRLQASPHL